MNEIQMNKCPNCIGVIAESREPNDVDEWMLPDYKCNACHSVFNYKFVQGLFKGRTESQILVSIIANAELAKIHLNNEIRILKQKIFQERQANSPRELMAE